MEEWKDNAKNFFCILLAGVLMVLAFNISPNKTMQASLLENQNKPTRHSLRVDSLQTALNEQREEVKEIDARIALLEVLIDSSKDVSDYNKLLAERDSLRFIVGPRASNEASLTRTQLDAAEPKKHR